MLLIEMPLRCISINVFRHVFRKNATEIRNAFSLSRGKLRFREKAVLGPAKPVLRIRAERFEL
jgi:hypothetical protein